MKGIYDIEKNPEYVPGLGVQIWYCFGDRTNTFFRFHLFVDDDGFQIQETGYLDKTTKSMELYNGNYDSFIKLHTEREKTLKRQAEIQEKEIEKLQAIVDKYASASGKRKKMAQDREKKLEKLLDNKIEVPKETKKAKIQMNANRESSNMPLKVEHLSFRYDISLFNSFL